MSSISAFSISALEAFHVWRVGGGSLMDVPARIGEAILILDNEWKEEVHEAAK